MFFAPAANPSSAAFFQHQEIQLTSQFLERELTISVLMPTNVGADGSLPVLYLNDGQDLDRLRLPATLQRLYEQQLVRPFVLIAPHANEQRLHEYGIVGLPDYAGRGGRAAAYARFVLEELLPFAQANYRASADPAQAVFAGFSLGGLSAFDLVWHHPELFARVGVFSGSFWWRGRALTDGYTPADRLMLSKITNQPPHPAHRFWLQTGTLDERNDRNENGVIDSVEDCLDLVELLVGMGVDASQAIRYVQVEGGRHHPDTWGQVMPDFLRWAFGPADSLPAPLPVVRLQLDPALPPAPPPTEPLAETSAVISAPAPLAVPSAAAVATDEGAASHLPDSTAAAEAAPDSEADSREEEFEFERDAAPNDAVAESSAMESKPAPGSIRRPGASEYQPFHEAYISLVPEGAGPHEVLRRQAFEVQTVFGVLSEQQAATAYAPGKWSIKQMLLHLVDTERVFAYRALRFARADAQALPGFEQDDYVANSHANERPMSSLLLEYAAVRAGTLALFDSLTADQIDRVGQANNAPVSVRALLFIVPGHERHHLNVFRERYLPAL